MLCLIWLILAGTCIAAESSSDKLVTWCSFDLPPLYMATGPQAGQGTVDRMAVFLQRKLPEYQHRFQLSNIARLHEETRKREHVVCAGLQKNAERERFMLFSDPFLTTMPPRVVFLRKHLNTLRPFLNERGELRLSEVIDRSGLLLGISASRSYGQAIDEVLGQRQNHPAIIRRTASEAMFSGIVQQMKLGRLDYAIAYGFEQAQFRAANPGSDDEAAEVLPIEGQPRYIPLYITAPQSAWGERFITRINTLLRRHWDDPAFRTPVRDPEDQKRLAAELREINPNLRR